MHVCMCLTRSLSFSACVYIYHKSSNTCHSFQDKPILYAPNSNIQSRIVCVYITHTYRFSKGSKLSLKYYFSMAHHEITHKPIHRLYKYIYYINTLDCCVEKFFVSQILHIYTLSISQFRFRSVPRFFAAAAVVVAPFFCFSA